MVVLSILALIAILAYNFFGNTMKEAQIKQQTTAIFDGLRVLSDAVELYESKHAGTPPADLSDLVSEGIIKALPLKGGVWMTSRDIGGPTAATDLAVLYWSRDPILASVCLAYNKAYSQTIGEAAATLGPDSNLNSGDGNIAEARANTIYCGPYALGDSEYDFGIFVHAE